MILFETFTVVLAVLGTLILGSAALVDVWAD